MNTLINIAAVALVAALTAAFVWAALRIVLRAKPDAEAPPPSKPSMKRRLASAGKCAALVAAVLLGPAMQAAFGAPVGERSSPVVEVLDVRECGRPPLGLGLVHVCELSGYAYSDPEFDRVAAHEPIKVVTADPIGPGDRVAEYTASGWERWLQLHVDGEQWRPVDDAERPNLVWLPAAILIAAMSALAALERLSAGRRSTAAVARPDVVS